MATEIELLKASIKSIQAIIDESKKVGKEVQAEKEKPVPQHVSKR